MVVCSLSILLARGAMQVQDHGFSCAFPVTTPSFLYTANLKRFLKRPQQQPPITSMTDSPPSPADLDSRTVARDVMGPSLIVHSSSVLRGSVAGEMRLVLSLAKSLDLHSFIFVGDANLTKAASQLGQSGIGTSTVTSQST